MRYTDTIVFVMELIGTIAFASSGAMLAMRKEMDLFGVCVLGVVTAVGGGAIRDVILGITPPYMFRNSIYTFIAIGISAFLFFSSYIRNKHRFKAYSSFYDKIMSVFDALGLGVFTVVGMNVALNLHYTQKFLLIFVGVITGVGGGLLRDIMAQEKPYILTKHIYACASIVGAFVCLYSIPLVGQIYSMLLGATTVFVIRFMAIHYHWNLPKLDNEI